MEKKQVFYPVSERVYKPFRITQVATRPGCLTVLRAPSRFGSELRSPGEFK